MDFDVSDSSGTDDDNPPSHQNRVPRGSRVAGIARSAVGSISHTRMHTDMEAQIHHLEQEAYCAVLRAFQAQSDAISWEKESLLTELRNELRVSNDSHRELLTRVNEDDIIRKLREWRKSGGLQATRLSTSLPAYDLLPSPTNSASRKKQKTSQLQVQQFPSLSSVKSMRYPSTEPARNRQLINRSSLGGHAVNEHPEAATFDPLIGRKVWTRWPADNSFYEALVTDYDAAAGRHVLVYDIGTENETWELVDLKEISPEDIRWEGEEMVTSHHGAHNGQGRGVKKSLNRGGRIPNNGRVRGPLKSQSMKDSLPSQNGISKKVSDDIELLNTDSLVKEVEMVFNTSHPDPFELEKAKKMLKEHEQALVDAIAKLAYASDGESDGEHAYTYGQSMDRG
ncbi:protein EMSY-LIKE 1 isoform X1 [Ziziphus jujuba]|uniref:Protein EMSY-LIKE 1 isoform X1 n=2 Tax=Ziziphus jujuba TaxID=326968 RepID=A0A6P4ATP3_ZIZJJ|nr:protein EMSY-LIKE 1 isoform X1 [Ziziphus jujuba]XP_060668749.1 protein EMSY-LIKE 1 isoform X1 [Ziziphus jujuba]